MVRALIISVHTSTIILSKINGYSYLLDVIIDVNVFIWNAWYWHGTANFCAVTCIPLQTLQYVYKKSIHMKAY
jgi:hypothetical protein